MCDLYERFNGMHGYRKKYCIVYSSNKFYKRKFCCLKWPSYCICHKCGNLINKQNHHMYFTGKASDAELWCDLGYCRIYASLDLNALIYIQESRWSGIGMSDDCEWDKASVVAMNSGHSKMGQMFSIFWASRLNVVTSLEPLSHIWC